MKHFLIITNTNKDANLRLTGKLQEYIADKGGTSIVFTSKGETVEGAAPRVEDIPKDTELVLVLGGDGTLIRAAAQLVDSRLPLIGVNMGTLGYLCELERSTVYDAIDRLFEDRYELETRMLIKGSSQKDGSGKATFALNDIVIHRTGLPQIVNLIVSVNGEYLANYSADGIIISTPTGSTGYSMSAGGPIVDPKADLMLITPINPHSALAKSIVVGSDAVIDVTLAKRRQEEDEEAEVSFDGDRFVHMKVGDNIRIQKADAHAKILKLNQLSFLQILRKKMQEFH